MKALVVLSGVAAMVLTPVGALEPGTRPPIESKAAAPSPPTLRSRPLRRAPVETASRAATESLVQEAARAAARHESAIPQADPDFDWRKEWKEVPQWGGRIGSIDAEGNLKVGFRYDDRPWVTVAKDVRSFQLFDWSLAVLKTDGTLLQQEGPLDAPLQELAREVCAYQLTLTRTGILRCDHTFLVREMGFDARPVATSIQAFQIESDRAAVLGFDGALWVQRGGAVRGFRRLAENVRRFQFERDWLAYVEEAPALGKSTSNRLMVGKWDTSKDLSFTEHARNVAEFEMEAEVDFGNDFQSKVRLAVISGGGLSVGAGEATPLTMRKFDRGPVQKLAWAGGRLAVLAAGRLKIAAVRSDGIVEGFAELPGELAGFHLTAEGALVVDRGEGSVDLLQIAAEEETEAADLDGASPKAAFVPKFEAMAGGQAKAVAGNAATAGGERLVGISSLRPRHIRRAVVGPPLEAAQIGASIGAAIVRFSEDPAWSDAARASAESGSGSDTTSMPARRLSAATAIPLYQLYLPSTTDHFYTTDPAEKAIAQGYGFWDQGIAAWVEPSQVAGTLPFWRFYMGAPRTDHFYTASTAEFNIVVSYGFTYEGVEGYLYGSAAAGTVPLYRLSWWNGNTGDGDHFYTTSDAAKNAMLAQGWGYDGIAGWVWGSGPAPAGDDAVAVSASVPPGITAGQSYTATVTMRNTGGTTWTAASAYRLGSQNPRDNWTWGLGRVELPASVAPGANVAFDFPIRAPAAAGTYNFQWQMVREGVAWFGTPTVNLPVVVSAVPNRPPLGNLEAVQTAYYSVSGWAYDPDVPSQSIGVHFDIDGAPAGDVVTDQVRPDVNSYFGITGTHGFLWYLPLAYRSGSHTLRAYSVDPASGARVEMWSSPISFNYPVAAFSISGNAGVPGATVSAGAFTATSDDNGNFTLANVPAGTYAVSASKTGCLFYPASQTVTVAPSRTRLFFSSPCRLRYVRGITSYADRYIQAYPYSQRSPVYDEAVYEPNNVYPCRASDDGRVSCKPNLPLWKSRDSFGRVCMSLIVKTVPRVHVRPRIGNYVPYAPNNYYWCSTCQILFPSSNPCSPLNICTYVDYIDHIRVADPIGVRGSPLACYPTLEHYSGYWSGPSARNVYEGEITPDYWGIVPGSPELLGDKRWQILTPPGRRLHPNGNDIGNSIVSGDGYWTHEPIRILPPPLMGGGSGPNCVAGATECVPISGRSTASLVNGQWTIVITGYLSADNILQNTSDAASDLFALGQLSNNGGASASVNAHVAAIVQFINDRQAFNAALQGHSLGAMDALVVYQLGFGSSATLYAPPTVLPNNVFLETLSPAVNGLRPILAYGGLNDTIANIPSSCNGSTNGCRVQLCSSSGRCTYIPLDTGNGFFTLSNPHDRCRYQSAANPELPCW